MFCGKCGAKNEDGASFCKECGESLTPAKPVPAGGAVATAKDSGKKNKFIGMAAMAVAVVVVLMLFSSLLSSGGAKTADEVALRYTDAMFKPDVKAMLKLIHKDVKKPVDKKVLKEIIADTEESVIQQKELLDKYLGEGWTYSCKVADHYERRNTRLENIQKSYETHYGLKVEEAQEVEVKVTISYGKSEESQRIYVDVIRIGNAWYLDAEDMSIF